MTRRYLLFTGYHYYPAGGWQDHYTASDDLQECVSAATETLENEYGKWAHIVDLEAMKIVWQEQADEGQQ